MANRYSYTKKLVTKETKKEYLETTIYPKIKPTNNDVYIITTSNDRLDILANKYYNDKNLNEVSNILTTDAKIVGDIYLLNANVFIRNLTQFITISYILIPTSINFKCISRISSGIASRLNGKTVCDGLYRGS